MAEWISPKDQMPPPGRKVIAYFLNEAGKRRRIMAQYAPLHALPLSEDAEGGCECGNCPEDADYTYCPEGWYETNEFDETHWRVTDTILLWTELPPWPEEAATETA